ncbi:hypothetical protein BV25DRAFT_1829638 [Artomyces pyxidatus]|uniref:Uncharacterized protein n=1 Tax=Artomyces pyxidatus TaxID=48021 RepID=A0ACB8SSJ6_9AGAM|nr:hypothetical protein BV25DRAFT_1829638 [Artomyces pyxidatus]
MDSAAPTDDVDGEKRRRVKDFELQPIAIRSPINRVPNEILREIFSNFPSFETCALEYSINVSQVCRLWRALALEMKDLWTEIAVGSQMGNSARHVELALERSVPRPITVHIASSWTGGHRTPVLRALRELPRVRVLCIGDGEGLAHGDLLDSVAQALRTCHTPRLEELRLYNIADDLFQDRLFAGQVSQKLRVLTVVACSLPPIVVRAPLTHLDVTLMDVGDLLEILRCLPSLEHLSFTPTLDLESSPAEFISRPVASLPRLRDISVTGFVKSITQFVQFLEFAVDVDLDLQLLCEDPSESPHYYSQFSWICNGRLSNVIALGLYYQDLYISSRDEEDLTLKAHNPVLPLGEGPRLPQEISLSFIEGHRFSDDTGIITPLLSFLPAVHSIRTLATNSIPYRFLREWESMSSRLPEVASIIVLGPAAHGLAMALNAHEGLFPHLTVLSIENVAFADLVDERPRTLADIQRSFRDWESESDSGRMGKPESEAVPELEIPSEMEKGVSFFEHLLKGLRTREAAGLPIGRVSIRGCDVTADMVAQVRTVLGADCVEWDGQEDMGPRPRMWVDI